MPTPIRKIGVCCKHMTKYTMTFSKKVKISDLDFPFSYNYHRHWRDTSNSSSLRRFANAHTMHIIQNELKKTFFFDYLHPCAHKGAHFSFSQVRRARSLNWCLFVKCIKLQCIAGTILSHFHHTEENSFVW